MKGTLLIHLFQFLAGILVVLVIIMSSYIISFQLFKRNWINTKLSSETLASAISQVISSSFDISLKIYTEKACDIKLLDGKVKTSISNEVYESSIVRPTYVKIRDSSSTCDQGFITIKKVGREVWIE